MSDCVARFVASLELDNYFLDVFCWYRICYHWGLYCGLIHFFYKHVRAKV